MARKRTHDQFVNELNIINPNIEALGTYINVDTKIQVKCKVCGHIWFVRPSDLLRKNNTGCPKCSAKNRNLNRTKTQSEFEMELYEINPNIEVLEKYVNNHTKVKVMCRTCKNIWHATSLTLISKQCGCPSCSIKSSANKRTKTHEEFVNELTGINNDIEVLGKYINNHTKVKCRCKLCKCVWYAIPNDMICKGHTGCPNCNMSKGERKIKEYLQMNHINYIPQKKYDGLFGVGNGLLSYDFYLPTYNLLVEYQGEFHDGSIKTGFQTPKKFAKQQEHDKRKREYAINNNIELLEIWYWDYDNIEKILNEKLNNNNIKKPA